MNTGKPHKAINLSDLIEEGNSNEFSFASTSILTNIDGIIYPSSNILDKYKEIILENCIEVTLSDEDLANYRYNPKALSLKLYKSIDLWFLLLNINGILSVSDFTKRTIKIYDPKKMNILNKILIVEKSRIDSNRSDLGLI